MRAALLAAALLLIAAAPAAAAPELVKVGDFSAPVHVASPPGDPRLFVVEKGGLVKVAGGGVFVDLRSRIDTAGERGLLSIAFAPDFARTGLYYVFFTAQDGDLRVMELPTGRTLVDIAHPMTNHNGGQLQFGPDGMLYASTGDGGGSNDPGRNAQDPTSQLGKILRIDPATGDVEIWASGLRNPWRFSFHGADMLIGDVGQGAYEEVDRATGPGMNFGWPCYEGTHFNPPGGCATRGTDPVFERRHADGFCSITGGYVVRDPGLPTLAGRYVYGDFCQSAVRSVALADPADDRVEPLAVPQIVSFGEDSQGRLHVASLTGPVYRVQDSSAPPPPPAPAAPAADLAAPRLSVRMRGVRRRHLRLRVRCDEPCRVVARGRLRGVGRLRKAERELAAATRTTVRVRMSRRTARRLRRTLGRRPRVIAAFTVRATDAAGNQSRVRRRARVRRRRSVRPSARPAAYDSSSRPAAYDSSSRAPGLPGSGSPL